MLHRTGLSLFLEDRVKRSCERASILRSNLVWWSFKSSQVVAFLDQRWLSFLQALSTRFLSCRLQCILTFVTSTAARHELILLVQRQLVVKR